MIKSSERLNEAIEEIIESEACRISMALEEIFSLLFWKDYSAGYVKLDDKQKLVNMINSYNYCAGNPEFGGYYKFDNKEEVKELITKIRTALGITEKLP